MFHFRHSYNSFPIFLTFYICLLLSQLYIVASDSKLKKKTSFPIFLAIIGGKISSYMPRKQTYFVKKYDYTYSLSNKPAEPFHFPNNVICVVTKGL